MSLWSAGPIPPDSGADRVVAATSLVLKFFMPPQAWPRSRLAALEHPHRAHGIEGANTNTSVLPLLLLLLLLLLRLLLLFLLLLLLPASTSH